MKQPSGFTQIHHRHSRVITGSKLLLSLPQDRPRLRCSPVRAEPSLTPYDPHAEVELLHRVAERGCDQAAAGEAPAHDHDGPAAVLVHQDAADGTWGGEGDRPRDGLSSHQTQNRCTQARWRFITTGFCLSHRDTSPRERTGGRGKDERFRGSWR